MPTKREWIDAMVIEGASDPEKEDKKYSCAYPSSYLKENEVIDIAWAYSITHHCNELDKMHGKYSKIRNRYAREMRKDGWTIRCSSYVNMWDQQVFKIEGERRKEQILQQSLVSPAEA